MFDDLDLSVGVKLIGPIALLFPGQGVQKPGMGQNLHDGVGRCIAQCVR